MTVQAYTGFAPAEPVISDHDRDALHILPLAALPIAQPALRRSRLVKNTHLDTVVELFNRPETGSGQVKVNNVIRLFQAESAPTQEELDLLNQVSGLSSFDVYSLRIVVRERGIPITDKSALNLSEEKIKSLGAYMTSFTRPLVAEIFGEDVTVRPYSDVLQLFRACDAETVRARLATMAERLGIQVSEIPKFLEDYGDIFMSLSYYRQCLDGIWPAIESFFAAAEEIRKNHQLSKDANLLASVETIENTFNSLLANITGRLESFDRSTKDMWRNLSAQRFRKIETLIKSYHTTIGGVLCVLSVKLDAWSQRFPAGNVSGPVRRAEFIMSEMRPGIDRVRAIEDSTPMLANLEP